MSITGIYDRVRETCTAPGTGTVTLLGAATGYQAFSAVMANGGTCLYCIADQTGNNWEVGQATWNTGGTLTRSSGNVLAGSAGASTLVNFSSGTQDVFITLPAESLNTAINNAVTTAEAFATAADTTVLSSANATAATLANSAQAAAETYSSNASNITSGTLGNARLPNPTALLLGGIKAQGAPTSHQWVQYVDTSGVQHLTQPDCSDLSGSLSVSQINATGSPGSTNYLRGDGSWSTPPGTMYSADGTSLTLTSTTFSINTAWAGQTAITTLGTITTGTWHGTAIAAAYIGNLPASQITSGQLALAQGGTGSDLSATGGAHQVLKQASLGGAVTVAQLAASDISGLAASATTDTTNASNISSGTLPAGRLPAPTAATLGGVQSITSAAHQWVAYIDTSGVPHQSQPAFSDISGSVAAMQLPNPGASSLGGVQSIAVVSHNFLTGISTSGVPSQAQPAFTDISGTASNAQIPAPTVSSLGGIQAASGATSHQWVSYVDTSGVQHFSQPAFTDISGSLTVSQISATGTPSSSTYLRGDGTWSTPAGSSYTADESTLHLSGTTFSIISTYVGQTSITTLGTIGTGTWQATAVGVTYGGTGANLSSTGGTNQVVQQSSSGAALTVGTLNATQLNGGCAMAVAAWATAAVLPNSPTYSNGTAGVGATLTAGSNSTLTVDGGTVASGDIVLVKNQASGFQNGIYTCTTAGSGSVKWVLTRMTGYDTGAQQVGLGVGVAGTGTANANSTWDCTNTSAPTMGTTAITFAATGYTTPPQVGAVALTPTSSAQNVILPTAGDYTGLTVQQQSGGGSNTIVFQIKDASGNVVFKSVPGNGTNVTISNNMQVGGIYSNTGAQTESTGYYAFCSTTNAQGTKDTSLYRASAGVVKVGTGTNSGQGGLICGAFTGGRTTVADAAYNILATDYIVAYTSLTAGRIATLPTAVGCAGQHYIIKDESGSAGTYNITMGSTSSQTIDGAAASSTKISTNYGVLRLYSNGSNWFTW